MKYSFSCLAALVFLCLLGVSPAFAQSSDQEETDERIAEFQQRLEEVRERLQLTDEQIEQLLPVMEESFEARRAVLEDHGVDLQNRDEEDRNRRMNLRQLRALGQDLDEVRDAMYGKIEEQGFLSDEQFAELKKIQEEQREALRERIRARRDS